MEKKELSLHVMKQMLQYAQKITNETVEEHPNFAVHVEVSVIVLTEQEYTEAMQKAQDLQEANAQQRWDLN